MPSAAFASAGLCETQEARTPALKFALVSDLHVDHYPDNQQFDWHIVRRWTGTDILVIAGNVSGSAGISMEEILLARQAFRCVIFVEGSCEHPNGYWSPAAAERLRQFAEQHDGIYYLGTGSGLTIESTLVCGMTGWSHFHAEVAGSGDSDQERFDMPCGNHDVGNLELGIAVLPDDLFAHHVELLAQQVKGAAADPSIHEIVVITYAAPHVDAITFTGDHICDLEAEAACTAALVPIWSDCLDGGKLTTWCFGRSSFHQDFTDQGVRFISNPRGCPGEKRNGPYTVQVIDTSVVMDQGFEAWA
ncbi:hypothetical protein JL100_010415 [Skermanella mucosa]|uniref:hypothetical protein n=1 Tax=Skermanella mucosa TaxID=1789672 RepID=UPI001E2FE43D|nr:hypothetical protein [Skermanella mucosa]UEM23128.1 hypothetical protein JL100_010415 [Skermanella mucosa]